MAHYRCNEGRVLITYCVCGRDATIDESPIIDAALAADRARIAAAIRELLPDDDILDRLLRVVEGK